MNVLLIAHNDWANLSYVLSQCLKKVGIEATALVSSILYKYPEHGTYFRKIDQVRKYAKKADIIIFMHSQWVNTGVDLKTKRVFVFHGGSAYREGYEKINKIFNPIVEKSIIQTGDLFGLGAKNEVWLLPAVDIDKLKPVYKKQGDKLIVGHFPSGSIVKSSEGINKVIEKISHELGHRFEYVFSSDKVSWSKQIKRVSECDIYVEACTPRLKSKRSSKKYKYGEWGVAGIEAAALGKVVISHFLSHERYKQEYGECSIKVANSFDEIEKHLRELLMLDDNQLLQIREDTRLWVERFHSYYSVGKRLKKIIYRI
jgi:hypothetical protein